VTGGQAPDSSYRGREGRVARAADFLGKKKKNAIRTGKGVSRSRGSMSLELLYYGALCGENPPKKLRVIYSEEGGRTGQVKGRMRLKEKNSAPRSHC